MAFSYPWCDLWSVYRTVQVRTSEEASDAAMCGAKTKCLTYLHSTAQK
jgi:hypothetical protein